MGDKPTKEACPPSTTESQMTVKTSKQAASAGWTDSESLVCSLMINPPTRAIDQRRAAVEMTFLTASTVGFFCIGAIVMYL